MTQPYFSIIIPVYKAEKVIGKCLESIVAQNFSSYELILVNDGSPDCSFRICQEYAKVYSNILIINQENGGPSKARNAALDCARGKYIMFIDSDDWIENNALRILFEFSQDNCPLIYHGFRVYFGNGDYTITIHGYRHSTNEQEYYDILYHTIENTMHNYIYGFTANKLFLREIIESHHIRFDERLHVREDEVFTNQYCSFVKEVKIIPFAFYNYRKSFGNSISFMQRTTEEYEYAADMLLKTGSALTCPKIQTYQKQEYIINLSKGITAAIRHRQMDEAWRLSKKCGLRLKEWRLSYNSFSKFHLKDRLRYRFANAFWIYCVSKYLNRFYTL